MSRRFETLDYLIIKYELLREKILEQLQQHFVSIFEHNKIILTHFSNLD